MTTRCRRSGPMARSASPIPLHARSSSHSRSSSKRRPMRHSPPRASRPNGNVPATPARRTRYRRVMTHPAYDQLTDAFMRVYRFEHLQAITMWDHSTYMPPGGNEARSAAMGELAALIHRLRTAPELGGFLERASKVPLDEHEQADLREMQLT